MEQQFNFPFCPPVPSDAIPMLVIIAVFVLGGWLLRRWKKKRASKSGK